MPEYVKKMESAAESLGVSRQAFMEWRRSSDFPAETKRGWNVGKIRDWCKANNRGPYRRSGNATFSEGDCKTISFAQANTRKTIEQAENERIKKERQLVEQATELGEILALEDVRGIVSQMVATVKACADALHTAVDRALPESHPSADAWPEIRARAISMTGKLEADMSAAMDSLW